MKVNNFKTISGEYNTNIVNSTVGKNIELIQKLHLSGVVLDKIYWSEALSHCPFSPHLSLLKKNHSKADAKTQLLIQKSIINSKIIYLKKQERELLKMHSKNGLIYNQLNCVYSTNQSSYYNHKSGLFEKGAAIYVIGPDKELYCQSHEKGRFYHSSFFSGEAVIGAGELIVENGKLKQISNESGHYRPNKANLLDTLTILKEKQLDLSETQILNRKDLDFSTLFFSAEDFLNSKGKCLPDMINDITLLKNKNGTVYGLQLIDRDFLSSEEQSYLKKKGIDYKILQHQVKWNHKVQPPIRGAYVEVAHESKISTHPTCYESLFFLKGRYVSLKV